MGCGETGDPSELESLLLDSKLHPNEAIEQLNWLAVRHQNIQHYECLVVHLRTLSSFSYLLFFAIVYKHHLLKQNCHKSCLKNRKSSFSLDSLQGLSETSPKWRMAAISSQRTAFSLSPFFLSSINQLKVPQWSSVWRWRGIYHSQIKARPSSTFAFTLCRKFMRSGGIVHTACPVTQQSAKGCTTWQFVFMLFILFCWRCG